MSKKRKRRPRTESTGIAESAPAGRKGRFYYGLAAGFSSALLFTLAMDLGWIPLHKGGVRANESAPAETTSTRNIMILGSVPEGAALIADGHPVTAQTQNGWTRAVLPGTARNIEIRGQSGPWWQADLTETGDTLRPVWSGEIVVEPSPHYSGGVLFVDGESRGQVPGTVGGIAPGWHVISVRQGDALVYEDARQVGPGEVVAWTVPAPPPSGKGRLIVRSRRMEAIGIVETQARPVRVDGRYRGATPLEINVPAGHHSVAVEEPGERVLVQVLRIESGATRYVQAQYPQDPEVGVEIGRTTTMKPDGAIVVPVRIVGTGVPIEKAFLQMVRPRQTDTVPVPLAVSPSDPRIWVGVIPKSLLTPGEAALAYAIGTDVSGKEGCSEIIDLYR